MISVSCTTESTEHVLILRISAVNGDLNPSIKYRLTSACSMLVLRVHEKLL